jgi:hypothetical protein
MLAILAHYAGDLSIEKVHGDILSSGAWAGREPVLITCMGDTLTHLPDISAVRGLIRHCAQELVPGGKVICSFRDYSGEPEGAVLVLPVQRDPDRIFLCRLTYGKETVSVEDILYSRTPGTWTRAAGTYPKVRLAPELLRTIMTKEGFVTKELGEESGMVTIIAEKSLSPD